MKAYPRRNIQSSEEAARPMDAILLGGETEAEDDQCYQLKTKSVERSCSFLDAIC